MSITYINNSRMKKGTALIALILMLLCQTSLQAQSNTTSKKNSRVAPFSKLDVAVTGGTTGIGIDFATPLNNSLRLRGGFTIMPHFEYDMDLPISIGEDDERKYDQNGNPIQTKFEKLAGMLEEITGAKVNDTFSMTGEPNFYNFKLLLDIFPLKNKHWHITAGVYAGSSYIGKAYNKTEDAPTLFATNMYNNMYDKALNDMPVLTWGDYCIYMPKLLEYGRMGAMVGIRDDGTIYKLEPDHDNMVKARMKVNSIKPYIGFGYGSSMMDNNNKYNISMECGLLFWGGVPSVIMHDGTDITKGFSKVFGKPGDYVDIVEKFNVFPVLNIRIARRLY